MRFVRSFVSSTWWTQQWFAQTPLQVQPVIDPSIDGGWSSIAPSNEFRWQPCHGDFQCARLQVPMDWHNPSDSTNQTVEIAVIKLEATVPVTDSTYGGAIVFNPGGPGGSGVNQIFKNGHSFRTLLSAGPDTNVSSAKHFDIIGFDPRGVNNTRPRLVCFPDSSTAAAHAIEEQTFGWVDTSSTSFDNLWASKRALAQDCSVRNARKGGIAEHMSTAAVARDIIEIFERHGQWREKEAARLLALPSSRHSSAVEKASIQARTVYRAGREMVQYWGFSYGTLLGGTLTAMYPGRVGRVILDGVVDMPDYMAGGWSTNLLDTDRQLPLLGEYCYNGGRENCPIYDSRGPTKIIEIVQSTLSHLQNNPISVPGDDKNGPVLVTYNDFQALLWASIVYNPLVLFPRLAKALSELRTGNGTTLANLKRARRELPDVIRSERCKSDGPFSDACITPSVQRGLESATSGIACGDALSWTNITKSQFQAYADELVAQSALIGGWWATFMMPCTAWAARARWRYDGDFRVPHTAHPILFIGNTVDPVTPFYNARKMAAGFGGAGLLHQNSEGHCSTAAPSLCSGRAIREYFQTGKLPGTVGGLKGWDGIGALCQPDLLPLSGYNATSPMPPLPKGEHDWEMWEALVELNRGGEH